jgi:GDP-L-fucose synthase
MPSHFPRLDPIDRNFSFPEPLNLAQGKGYAIRESAELIAEAVGFKGEIVFRTDYPDGAPRKIMDNQRFNQFFPNYQFFDHYEAICQTVDYYRSVLYKGRAKIDEIYAGILSK